jgi:hypothetical protein
MKKVVSLIILGLMFLFSGCAPAIYNAIPNIEQEKFSIVLKIDEDMTCKNEDFIFNFKKGDRFGGYSFKGKTLLKTTDFPDYAIGFPIHPHLNGAMGYVYIVIQENGNQVFEKGTFMALDQSSIDKNDFIGGFFPNIICYKNNIPFEIKFNLESK